MYNQFIQKITTSLIVATLVFTIAPTVQAKKNDFQKKVHIKSERNGGDLKNKIISYMDNVLITQGSITINADLVQVMKRVESEDHVYLAKGKPAKFEQLLDDGTPLTLQADEIKYDPGNNLVSIKGNALLEQDGTKMSGSTITYNFLTEQFNAESNNNEQTETVLEPKKIKALQDKKKAQ